MKERGEKKENSTELQKPNIEAEVYNNNKKWDWIYTYTYTPTSKVKIVQQKVQYIDPVTKEIKSYIYQLRAKLTKAQTGKQN